MVWLTWRQHRAQVLVTAGFLVAVGALLLAHGAGAAGLTGGALSARFESLYTYLSWLPVVPLAAGLFWGAPVLARELERGTHRLAWTQSVSRRRWLAAKLGLLGGAVTVAGLALGAMISAWLTTFDGTNNRVNPMEFKGLSSHDVKLGIRVQCCEVDPPPPPPLIRKG